MTYYIVFVAITFIIYTAINWLIFYKINKEFGDFTTILKPLIPATILGIIIIFISPQIKDDFILYPLINLCIYFLTLKFLFKINYTLTSYIIIIFMLADLLAELIVVLTLKFMFQINVSNIPYFSGTYLLILILVAIIFYLIILFFIKNSSKLLILKKSINKKHAIVLLVCIICITFPNCLLLTFNLYEFNIIVLILVITGIIISSLILFLYIKNSIFKEDLQMRNRELELQNKNLEGLIDGVRALKHDYNNIFQIVNGYISTKNYEDLNRYVQNILNECNALNMLSALNKDNFDDGGIYGIIGTKNLLAIDKDIRFEIDSSISYKELNFDVTQLSRILGILLDNSIEATLKTQEKIIRYEAKFNPRKCSTIIKIYNTFDTSLEIDTSKIFEKGNSSKKIKSGIGLWEVKKIMKKYKNSQIFANIENDFFVQTIIIE